MSKRLDPRDRREQLLAAALEVAAQVGYQQITRQEVAARAGVEPALVTHYFGTMPKLRRHVIRAAVARGCLRVVAQGLAVKDPHALKASDEMKEQARGIL